MQLLMTMRALGKKRPLLDALPFIVTGTPDTLRALITACVCTCAAAYNARVDKGETASPMTEESLAAMETVGKLAFGITLGKRQEPAAAIAAAIRAWEDGLVRVFLKETELTDLDAPLALQENDRITFIRLTFMTGGFF